MPVHEGLPGWKNLRSKHALRWLGALLISLAVHYWIFAAFIPSAGDIRRHRPAPTWPVQHMEVRMVQPNPAHAEPPPLQAPSPPEQQPDPAATHPDLEHAPVKPANRMPPPAALPRSNSNITFYTVDEVDQPAHPRLDWEFPADSVTAAGLQRMIIQLWILDDGKVLDVDIISTTPAIPNEQVNKTIAKWLMQTDVTPAIKDGHRVASQRTLEIVFDLQP